MKILFGGDVCPTIHTDNYFQSMDLKELFGDSIAMFEGNDYNIVNLECVITESSNEIEKFGPWKRAPQNMAKTLKKAGVTHCLLSNNHIFDYGIEGLNDTLKALEEANLPYNGIGDNYEDSRKNLVLEKNGETICIIAVCEKEYSYALEDRIGTRPFDVFDTPNDVREAKAKYDKVIVIYHGGKEYCRYPSPRLHKVCHVLVDCGADVVLCQHSHCVGCYETYNSGHILYGQGNFHFASLTSKSEGWQDGLAVIYDTATKEIEFIHLVNTEHGIELAKGERKAQLEAEFTSRCEDLKDGKWKEGWKAFCDKMKYVYLTEIKKVFELTDEEILTKYNYLGHALDCEAHHDVLTEMFPTANSTNEK